MIIQAFKAAVPRFSNLFSTSLFFDSVRENFPLYFSNNFYMSSDSDALFIYQYQGQDRTYTGLIAGTDTSDYIKGSVVKHEGTLVAKEKKQRKLALERRAMIKPILLTYPKTDRIDVLLKTYIKEIEPVFNIEFREAQHTFWKIGSTEWINKFTTAFAEDVPKAYIADGHHRAATVAKMHEETQNPCFSNIFSIYVSFEEVEVSNWNRIIHGLNGLSPLGVIAEFSKFFDIERIPQALQPTEVRTLAMYLNKEWFKLNWRPWVIEKYNNKSIEQRFDISIFNTEIGQGILGIGDVRSDERIENVESRKGLKKVEQIINNTKEKNAIGFIFSPIALEDMISVTNAGKVMPPKSTYMLPRMANGMLICPLQ